MVTVAPLAGAWIEIPLTPDERSAAEVAPLAGAWIEIEIKSNKLIAIRSRSPRGSVD